MSAWRSNLVRKTERRRHARFPVHSNIRILWEDNQGRERVSDAEILDISVSGIKIFMRESIPLRSYVTCNDVKLGICGRGSVRYSIAAGRGYHVGLEFSTGISRVGPDGLSSADTQP